MSNVWKFLRESGLGKFLILAVVVFVVVALITYIYLAVLNNQPIKTEHAEVVSKRIARLNNPTTASHTVWIVTFKIPDGLEKEFRGMSVGTYNDLQEGDTGILTYRETKNNTQKLLGKSFISFEKDEQ